MKGKMIYVPYSFLKETNYLMEKKQFKNRKNAIENIVVNNQKWRALEQELEDINRGFNLDIGYIFKRFKDERR